MIEQQNVSVQDVVRLLVACGERPTVDQASRISARVGLGNSTHIFLPREVVSTEFLMTVYQTYDDVVVTEV